MDPPRHRVYRSLVNKVFSASRVEKMRPYIEQIVEELIDGFIDKGECEFVHDFAAPLPGYVIAGQLGVPRSDLRRIKAWSDAFASRLGGLGGMASAEEEVENARNILEYQRYMTAVIEDRRANPQDDMISDLANIEVIEEGSLLMLRYAAANRDEDVFERPDEMDVCRHNASDHLAFGQGTHFCPGAMLARREMQVA
jgi:cytochrome P450